MMKRNKKDLVYLVMTYVHAYTKIPPFSLMLLSNVLKKNGFEVKVIHCTEKDIAKEAKRIIDDKPLFVGFSVITGLPTLYSAKMSKLIKENSKKDNISIPIVWGGVHPSLVGEQCIKEDYIDYIVQGEGEEVITKLADCISKGKNPKDIHGVGCKINNKIVVNKKAPFIGDVDYYDYDFDCVDLNDYVHLGNYMVNGKKIKLRTLGYYSSRGCPHNCAFCFNLNYNQRRWRGHSIERVMKDINFLKKKYDVECVEFWDDNFFTNRKRALEILEGIKCYFKIEIRADYLNDDLAKKLNELGSVYILIGAESGSDRILKLMNKGFTTKQILEKNTILSKYGLTTQYSLILGVPSETKEELYKTIDMMYQISKIHKNASFTVGAYLPYPGTEFYEESIKRGFKVPENTEEWSRVDRWRNTVELPWIDNKLCLNIRHLFAMLGWANPFVRLWAKFRIKHKIINLIIDLRIIIRMHTEIVRVKHSIKNMMGFEVEE